MAFRNHWTQLFAATYYIIVTTPTSTPHTPSCKLAHSEAAFVCEFLYSSLAPAQISPVFTPQLLLDGCNAESTHYSEVWAVGQKDAGKKTNGAKRWMGGVLPCWHQSQLGVGGCPGNGTSDLIYPLFRAPHFRLCAFPHRHALALSVFQTL